MIHKTGTTRRERRQMKQENKMGKTVENITWKTGQTIVTQGPFEKHEGGKKTETSLQQTRKPSLSDH